MRLAAFFAGIGGLELGLELAGLGPTVFQCELDPYCRTVLEKHWPGVPRHDDIRTLDPASIPEADIWCGGFPCQDISVAGKGAGLEGARSGLWWDWYERIRVVRPPVVVVENVAAFAVRGLRDVLGVLADLGYDAEWARFGAVDVGAPHRRQRIWLIASLPDALRDPLWIEQGREHGEGGPGAPERLRPHPRQGAQDPVEKNTGKPGIPGAPGPDADSERCSSIRLQEHRDEQGSPGHLADGLDPWRWGSREDLLRHTLGPGLEERPCLEPDPRAQQPPSERAGRPPGAEWWASEPGVGRVADGVPHRVDRLRALGNAVVPWCAQVVGQRIRDRLK